MFPVNVIWGHRCGLHMTATTAIPEAVLTGLAFSLGRRAFLYAGGTAAMMSTSLGWVDRPYLLAIWPFSLIKWCVCVCVCVCMCICIYDSVYPCIPLSWSWLVEIDVFALFVRFDELCDYLSHSHHHTLSLRGLHSCTSSTHTDQSHKLFKQIFHPTFLLILSHCWSRIVPIKFPNNAQLLVMVAP